MAFTPREIRQKTLLSVVTTTGASEAFDKESYNTATILIQGTGATTNTATVTIEGAMDDAGPWFSIPYRTPSNDTPTNSDITLTDATDNLYYIDPKYVRYLRVNVSANASAVPVTAQVWSVF